MYRNVHYYVTQNQGFIKEFTWNEKGERISIDSLINAKMYYEDDRGKFTSLFKTNLSLKEFPTSFERNNWQKNHPTIRPFGSWQPEKQYLLEKYKDDFEKQSFSQFPLRTLFIDIEAVGNDGFPEPEDAKYPINAITVYDTLTEKYHTWAFDEINQDLSRLSDRSIIHFFKKEDLMILDFLQWFEHNCPDIISGWNVEGFDIPYIVNRIKKFFKGKEVMLSPVGVIKKRTRNQRGHPEPIETYNIAGVTILDYFFLYKYKFGKASAQSFKLGDIGMDVLGESKLEYDGSLFDFKNKDFTTFIEYNIKDVDLVVKLDKRLKFINQTRNLCNMGLCEYEDVFGSSSYITGALVLEANNDNVILPSQAPLNTMKEGSFTGAYVFPPQVGICSAGVATFDISSLYPNMIISCNISPETKVGMIIEDFGSGPVKIKDRNNKEKIIDRESFNKLCKTVIKAANGALYCKHSQRKGILPRWLEKTYEKRQARRKEAKSCDIEISKLEAITNKTHDIITKINELKIQSTYADSVQNIMKVFLNSVYGQLGNKFFSLFDLDNAEAVTLGGQHISKNSAIFLNEFFKKKFKSIQNDNVILMGDTDSCEENSLIYTTLGIFRIKDFWELTKSNIEKTQFGHEMKSINEKYKVLTFDEKQNKPVYDKATKIIRHKVCKEKYKIQVGGKEVIVTGDHSCIVLRDNKLKEICAKDITPDDYMIVLR